MIRVTIMSDIQEQGYTFKAGSSKVVYDSKKPRLKKQHQLIYQQGETYGAVGDYCVYLNHHRLEMLEAAGHIRIDRYRRRRRPPLRVSI